MARYAQYWIEVRHDGLGKYRCIRGNDRRIIEEKAYAQQIAWDAQWERELARRARLEARQDAEETKQQGLADAEDLTRDAQEAVAAAANILADGLATSNAVNWGALKVNQPYEYPPPAQPHKVTPPPAPSTADRKYKPAFTILDYLVIFTMKRKRLAAQELFDTDTAAYWSQLEADAEHYARAKEAYPDLLAQWQARKDEHEVAQTRQHAEIDSMRERYLSGDADTIGEYVNLVLENSIYPEFVSREWALEYLPEQRTLVLDYDLPQIEDIPTLLQIRYVASRSELSEKHATKAETAALYDDVLYKSALRTIHEIFESDEGGHIDFVSFNGWVEYIDKAKGKDARACIMSVVAAKNDFEAVDLGRVDPRECFRSLKGVASTKLHSYAPVAPLMQMNRSDKRFIGSVSVLSEMDAGRNLASMHWEEFEHLVREVFEHEFSANGGEVRITQASRDGGVDAVAFDPDPIRGGKIIIQAKRYTNPVDLSSVRDLYGAVQNERAMKGILVTTSQFGPDAYKFAQDKPLTLIDGANLLYLLHKRGIKARIDIAEAKSDLNRV